MDKFDEWNYKKKYLNSNQRNLLFKEGEIWWCSLGINIGEETHGKGIDFNRPVLIIKKLTNRTCVVLPITTKNRNGSWYYHLRLKEVDRWIMLHQIRFIAVNRFSRRELVLSNYEFDKIKKPLAILLGLI